MLSPLDKIPDPQLLFAFDSWVEMLKWDGIDAVYIATPTFVKEEIAIAAAKAGKHVLCEKPLPSLPSFKRILAACHENNVAFMDGTHLSHHPRSIELEEKLDDLVGKRRTLHSVFQFNLRNKDNIRLSPTMEPMGAIGDAGWYNMRATVDYISPTAKVQSVSASLTRDPETKAVLSGTGFILFDDGSTSTFHCAINHPGKCVAELDGDNGSVEIPGFVRNDKDNSASYIHRSTTGKSKPQTIKVKSPRHGSAAMFEDFTKIVHDPSLRPKWETKSERTQELLDAFWESALANEEPS